MARSILAQLVVALRDDASGPAKSLAGTLKGVEKNANDFAKTMNGAKWGAAFGRDLEHARTSARDLGRELANASWGSKFSDQLSKLKIAPREFDAVRRSWRELQRDLANPIGGRSAFHVLGAESAWKKKQLFEITAVRAEMARLREEASRPLNLLRRGGRTLAVAGGVYGGARVVNRAGRGLAIAGASDKRENFRQGLAGLSEPERKAISAESDRLTGLYPSISAVDIQELARGARNLTGDVQKGLALLPDIVRARVAIQSATGGSGDGELDQLLKSADIAGLQDNPARFRAFLESFTKATQVEGKQISAGDYLSFYRRAKMAGSGFSDDFIASAAPSLIQEMGGPTAGTALATYFQQMAGGRAKKETLANQQKAGLRGEDGTLVDRKSFISDPFEWTQKYIRPLLEKNNVDTSNNESMIDFLLPLFSERNAAEVASKFILQADQISRNKRMYSQARGLPAAEEARHEDPFVAGTGALNALRNAAAELAGPAVPMATSALNTFADAMNGLARRLREDPSIAKTASATATGAAAGGTLGGSFMALRALWQGKGAGGAIAGLLKGGAVGGLTGGILGFAASKAAEWFTTTASGVGKVAAGAHWKPEASDGRADTEAQLADVQKRIADIKARTHPSRINEPNPDVQRLELEAADLRNRLAAGSGGTPAPAPTTAAPALAPPPASPTPGASSPTPLNLPAVDAAGAAASGQAAGAAIGTGVTTGLAAQAPAVASLFTSLLDRLRSLASGGVTVPVTVQQNGAAAPAASPSPAVPARASGGSVTAGSLYRVNEYGEEFFQPSENGRIIDPRRKAPGGGGGSGPGPISVSNSFTISGASDPQAIAQEVMSVLQDEFQRLARAAFADYGTDVA